MPPQAVTAAINRFVDEHVLQLDRVLSVVERRLGDEAIAAMRHRHHLCRTPPSRRAAFLRPCTVQHRAASRRRRLP